MELKSLWVKKQNKTHDPQQQMCFYWHSHPMPAPSSSIVEPAKEGSMERISGSSFCVSSWARESSIISSTVAPLECSFQNSVMFVRTEKDTGDKILINLKVKTVSNQNQQNTWKCRVVTVDFSTDNMTKSIFKCVIISLGYLLYHNWNRIHKAIEKTT